MKKKFLFTLVVALLFCGVFNGQVLPPPVPPPPPPGLPIDGGVIFLIVSAIFLGIKKIKE